MENSVKIRYGCYSSQAGRPYQEDRITALTVNPQSNQYFFAIYDGHGGSIVSDYASKTFHMKFTNHEKFRLQPLNALQDTWASFDDFLLKECQRIQIESNLNLLPSDGSTATICYVNNEDFYITNCGDSSAYSITINKVPEIVTEEHSTTNPLEVERCKVAGGTLRQQKFYQTRPFPFCCIPSKNLAKPRLYPGGLLVTRSFGDFHAKGIFDVTASGVLIHDHGKIRFKNVLYDKVKYLILASDGVWDVLSIEEIHSIILKCLNVPLKKSSFSEKNIRISTKVTPSEEELPLSGERSPSKVDINTIRAVNEVKDLMKNGIICSSTPDQLDPAVCKCAKLIVEAAVNSPKWQKLGFLLNI